MKFTVTLEHEEWTFTKGVDIPADAPPNEISRRMNTALVAMERTMAVYLGIFTFAMDNDTWHKEREKYLKQEAKKHGSRRK